MPQTLTGVNGGTFPNQCSAPLPGELITAASVYTGEQGLLNECKYLYDTKGALAVANTWTAKQTFDIGGGGVGIETTADTDITCNGAVTIASGATLDTVSGSTTTIAGDLGITGAAVVNNTTFLAGTGSRLMVGAQARWAQFSRDLANSDHTLNLTDGGVCILAKPTAVRTITIEQASDGDKADYDTWEFHMPDPPTVGNYYEIKREGSANYIVRLHGTIAGNQEACFVKINLRSGVWRGVGGVAITLGSDW